MLAYLTDPLGLDAPERDAWYRHWVTEGFAALEQLVVARPFCTGATPGYSDFGLVPQMFNARRFNVDVSRFPKLVAIDAACNALDPFARAHPNRQPDVPKP